MSNQDSKGGVRLELINESFLFSLE